MIPKSLTDLLWKDMDSFYCDVNVLKTYKIKTCDVAKKAMNNATRNVKKRKNYNSRGMGYKLEIIKRHWEEVNTILE